MTEGCQIFPSPSKMVKDGIYSVNANPTAILSLHELGLTSKGYLTPSRLCSEPSEEALQRPQWKVMRPTLNFDLRPPPLM